MKQIFLTLLMGLSFTIHAQNCSRSIDTDRPGQALTPYILTPKLFQVQSGITFREVDYTNASSQDDKAVEAVFRYGISRKLEVGGTLNYLNTNFNSSVLESSNSGISSTSLQARYYLYRGNNFFHIISMQLSLGIPVINDEFQQDYIYPRITLMSSKRINRYLFLTTNIGANWSGYQTNPDGFYVINLSYSLSRNTGVFVEQYSTFNNDIFEPKIDGGFSYLIKNGLLVDLSAGYYTEASTIDSDFFISVGISGRILLRKLGN